MPAREPAGRLEEPAVIAVVCARGTGVGADGIVFLRAIGGGGCEFAMRYLNSDGSPAALCGNACLCVTRLATLVGAGSPSGMRFATESGVLGGATGRRAAGGRAASGRGAGDRAAVEPEGEEQRIGFALVGVPHLVVLMDDVGRANVVGRGRPLRRHGRLARPARTSISCRRGTAGRWQMRTYERGVEGETLACGTGAIAVAMLLLSWGASASPVTLETRSGRQMRVRAA